MASLFEARAREGEGRRHHLYRRYGGAFSLGLGRWEQCRNKAVVMLKVEQEQVKTMPACRTCWNEAKAHGLKILSAEPIQVNHETKP